MIAWYEKNNFCSTIILEAQVCSCCVSTRQEFPFVFEEQSPIWPLGGVFSPSCSRWIWTASVQVHFTLHLCTVCIKHSHTVTVKYLFTPVSDWSTIQRQQVKAAFPWVAQKVIKLAHQSLMVPKSSGTPRKCALFVTWRLTVTHWRRKTNGSLGWVKSSYLRRGRRSPRWLSSFSCMFSHWRSDLDSRLGRCIWKGRTDPQWRRSRDAFQCWSRRPHQAPLSRTLWKIIKDERKMECFPFWKGFFPP